MGMNSFNKLFLKNNDKLGGKNANNISSMALSCLDEDIMRNKIGLLQFFHCPRCQLFECGFVAMARFLQVPQ